eukprot:1179006-Prorocentrum_minimum.AAC.2
MFESHKHTTHIPSGSASRYEWTCQGDITTLRRYLRGWRGFASVPDRDVGDSFGALCAGEWSYVPAFR